jgi:hypothetical protein
VIRLGPRDPGEIVGPRRLSDVVDRPLNFTVDARETQHPDARVRSSVRAVCCFGGRGPASFCGEYCSARRRRARVQPILIDAFV